jgi:deoxycytidylate deaminase
MAGYDSTNVRFSQLGFLLRVAAPTLHSIFVATARDNRQRSSSDERAVGAVVISLWQRHWTAMSSPPTDTANWHGHLGRDHSRAGRPCHVRTGHERVV